MFDFAAEFGVRVETLTEDQYEERVGRLPGSIYVLTYPVEDPAVVYQMRGAGVKGIYTSYLTPMTVPELFQQEPYPLR